jgi:hypothetical protein
MAKGAVRTRRGGAQEEQERAHEEEGGTQEEEGGTHAWQEEKPSDAPLIGEGVSDRGGGL